MKKHIICITALMLLMSSVVSYAIHETMPSETIVPLPGPDSRAVYKYITTEEPYKKWDLWPGKGTLYKGRPPLEFVTTHVNDNALYSIHAGKQMANRSLIVTENYGQDKKLSAIFVMYKIKGYNPSAGDWFWAQYGTDGRAVNSGKVDGCIQCHMKVQSNDYIFTEKFVK